jgi:hypothetical protein
MWIRIRIRNTGMQIRIQTFCCVRNTDRLRIQIQRAYYRTVVGSEFNFHFPDGATLSGRPTALTGHLTSGADP